MAKKEPFDDKYTYVPRRGVFRNKNTILTEIALLAVVALLGVFLYFHGNIKKAKKDFEEGRFELCIEKLKRALFFAPLDKGLHYKIALAHSRLRHHQEVIEICHKILALPKAKFPFQFRSGLPWPSLTEVYLGLAISYLNLEQYNEVIMYTQMMLVHNRNDALAYKLLGKAHMKKSMLRKDGSGMKAALKFLERARELAPEDMTPEDHQAIRTLREKLSAMGLLL